MRAPGQRGRPAQEHPRSGPDQRTGWRRSGLSFHPISRDQAVRRGLVTAIPRCHILIGIDSGANMRQPNDPEPREAARRFLLDPQHRRLRAFHECGHAVWLFLDGREDELLYVEIAPTGFGPGIHDFDTGVCAYSGSSYTAGWVLKGRDRKEQLSRAARCVTFAFAGAVCESMSTGLHDPTEIWEEALRSEWEFLVNDATTFSDDPRLQQIDFGQALQAVYAIYPTRHQRVDDIPLRQTRYLVMATQWTIETFSNPDVWQVVEALASEFDPVTVDRLNGDRVRQIISETWADRCNEGIPLHRLGPKWGRRYGCTLEK
jgi:hypothetical protein